MQQFINIQAVETFLAEAAAHYEKSAPTVTAYVEDLYLRFQSDGWNVRLSELASVSRLKEEGTWEHPNYAANRIYHIMHRLGMDTTGHAGF